MNFNKAEFKISAANKKDFVHNDIPQVAFAGRSNVGKSSTINKLLNRKNFARVGAQPGKTVHVNYFLIDDTIYFVDLPGYGFAKVSMAEKQRWSVLMESFFAERTITVGVLIVDARHKPTADDVMMADWFKNTGSPLIVAANKLDKCKKSEIEGNLALIAKTLDLPEGTPIVPFSAETGAGKNELLHEICSRCGVESFITAQ